ncbi:MAG: amino acid permease [Gemmatimonadota bacterium]|nr:amino acid permease [Gemmatimonadota bacterium]MDH5198879.1 amino acid permease [Gemmatimonadota bacterium]
MTQDLRRSIGIWQATAMVAGTIIGASIFVQPSVITAQVPSLGAVTAVWIVAGILTLFGALVTAELASAFPETGGVYVFLREAFSPALGFLWAWAMFWSMHTGIIAAIAVVFATYVGHFVELSPVGVRAVAILGILALSAINYVGVRHGSRLQTAFTIGKVVAIVGIVVIGYALAPTAPTSVDTAIRAATTGTPPLTDFALALVAGLFAFGGWHMVTYAAGETVEPERTIPRALLLGTLIVTLCYVALNAVYFRILPLETVVSSERVAADAANVVMGPAGAAAVSALVVFSTFGALSGIVLSGPRVYYSMARDGLLFRWAGEVHPRFRTPHRAIILQAVWAAVLVATGTYRALFTRVVYTEWIFFGLMAVGLVLLRRRPGYAPRYRVWSYPALPIVFALASAAIVVNQIVSDPRESAVGLAIVAIGLPIYYLWTRHAHRRLP